MVHFVDRVAQGDPDTVVYLPSGESLVGLYVRGTGRPRMLGIREDREGRPVSCAEVTDRIAIDTTLPILSNPRRRPDPPPLNGEDA